MALDRIPGRKLEVRLLAIDPAYRSQMVLAGLLGTMRAEDRVAAIRELLRVLRPGGRVTIVGAAPRGGLGALISRTQSGPPFAASGDAIKALEADGFRSARVLAEREGLVFVEGIKPRQSHG